MKYKPSVKANNAMRDEVAKKLQGVIFDIDKGRYNKDLNGESVQQARKKLYDVLKNFEEIVGTGDENIECFYNTALIQIDDVKDQMKSYLSGRLIQSVDDLDYTIDKWSSVLYGDVDSSIAGEELQKRETSSVRRKLEEKLSELKDVQSEYLSNEKRLEAEMQNLERDIDELNDAYAYALAHYDFDSHTAKDDSIFSTDYLEHLLANFANVDLDEINYVRLVDIVGDGSVLDSTGTPIYDAYPTHGTPGFDLSGIGVINAVPEPAVFAAAAGLLSVFVCISRRRRR